METLADSKMENDNCYRKQILLGEVINQFSTKGLKSMKNQAFLNFLRLLRVYENETVILTNKILNYERITLTKIVLM